MTRATITTEIGDIDVDLFDDAAPKAAGNFADLARKGYYDDVIFHRVIPGFVIQAGDGQHGKKSSLDKGRVGTGGPGYTFEDEPVKGEYVRGALAMANAGPNTNGSQFFITVTATQWLTAKHTIFGEVADAASRDVVDRIATTPTGGQDRPVEDIVIKSVQIERRPV
jgi:cyclophilin family peptidyl-prolyl cis-trans isomerase